MADLTYTGKLTVIKCWCGMRHAVPDELWEEARRKGKREIYCPLGHSAMYNSNPEMDRVRKECDDANERARRESDRVARLMAENDQLAASRRSIKGVVTKLKKRIVNGVCPCCKRAFTNLKAHMHTKHPDFANTDN